MRTCSNHCREAGTGLQQSHIFVGLNGVVLVISLGKSMSGVVGKAQTEREEEEDQSLLLKSTCLLSYSGATRTQWGKVLNLCVGQTPSPAPALCW